MKHKNLYFAEIVESSLQQWTAQSWTWNKFPNFGSLVAVEQEDQILFGIVSQIQTGSSDPSRLPYTYQKTEEELLKEHPQIFEFLRTILTCIPIGYCSSSSHCLSSSEIKSSVIPNLVERPIKFIYSLPLKPAKIHSFVRNISHKEKQNLEIAYCLPMIVNNNLAFQNTDELLLVLIKQFKIDSNFIKKFIENFSLLCANDYKRIKTFIKRIETIL